ncbi:DUF488 domain-containing protein [Verrucomicrobium sp. BvORR106]|uniref:DUF488 domain-containing protein n=1 Tax=Verrucomicrobium sp. BvORR106 TaxID=1403819 RepID=UPI002241013A|nr:DUF488 domain-containing protein [Verrucomicrobium sp. BvORR106]
MKPATTFGCECYTLGLLNYMLFERQKRLLALTDALGGSVGNLDFQKLLFLFCKEVEDSPSFDFVPYRFGGFSFTSYADKRKLVANGMLADEERSWKITPTGRATAAKAGTIRIKMDLFARRQKHLRGDALVAEVYRRHPWYATRSEMAERILAGDSETLAAITAVRPVAGQPGICTIGYEGRSLEDYLNRLLRQGATLLCDVRRNPLSRKYGFSKSTLARGCEGVGIRYEHLPELGIASEERRELNTQTDYDELFAVYERESLPKQTSALSLIRSWVASGQRVALTCYEHLPHQCHRHCVARALERDFGPTFTPTHL